MASAWMDGDPLSFILEGESTSITSGAGTGQEVGRLMLAEVHWDLMVLWRWLGEGFGFDKWDLPALVCKMRGKKGRPRVDVDVELDK